MTQVEVVVVNFISTRIEESSLSAKISEKYSKDIRTIQEKQF